MDPEGRNVGCNVFFSTKILEKIRKFKLHKLQASQDTRNHLKMKKREARTFHLPPLDNKLTTFQLHSHQKFVLYRSRSYLESSLSRICIHQRGSSRCRFRNGVVDNAGAHAISNY